MSRLLSSDRPMPTAAQPEPPLSRDMTTGISAPPIGKINKNPKMRTSVVRAKNKVCSGSAINHTDKAMTEINKAALSGYCSGKVIDLAVISPCNLAKATKEPEKARPPMIMPMVLSRFFGDEEMTSDRAMQTAARPPKPLKAAIICGRAVILTLSAE